MDRRSFLRGLGMVVAGVVIDQAIPLGRVWSFPSKIYRPPFIANATVTNLSPALTPEMLRKAMAHMKKALGEAYDNPPVDIWIHPAQRREYLKLIGE